MSRSINIRKGVLLFSIILVTLLMWLSVSFLMTANAQRRDAQFLTQFIETDEVLREASIILAEEHSASYWLTGIDGLFFGPDPLTHPSAATDEAILSVVAQTTATINKRVFADRLRFQLSHLKLLINGFESKTSELPSQRTALALDLLNLSNDRDQNLQLNVLNYYQELIKDLQVLRYGLSYDSAEQSRGIRNTLEVSNAAWNIRLSNHFLIGIYEGYITTGNTARGDAHAQATTLHKAIEENLEIIKQIDSYSQIDPQIHELALDLSEWYTTNYQSPVLQISEALASNTASPISNYEWKETATALGELTQKILERADVISKRQALVAEERAVRNLIIDTALVFICGLFVLFAYWLARGMHHQATHDELTDLPNRRFFKTHLETVIDSCGKNSQVSLLKVDLYKFKAVNDSFGQGTGDLLLQSVARRLHNSVGQEPLVARLAGDEYAVLLYDTDRNNAKKIADDLAVKLSAPYQIDDQQIQLNTYLGYACYPDDASDCEGLRKSADLAMYEAKQVGPGSITAYKEAFAIAFQERQQLEADLSEALNRNEFELHYQPQFDLETCVVDGVEALIRWRHPTRGMVSPFHFIPVAEDAGLLPAIGEWVINEAARQTALWQRDFGLHLRMSVNVSTHQFLHGDLVGIVTKALQRENLKSTDFEIEITESVAMADLEMVVEKLEKIHAMGVLIALDDFGTGYSSLSYIQDLPLDTLKIDKSFIDKLDQGKGKERQLLESIANMAKLLDFHTVAEGVETSDQLSQVRALGIDTVQGYYYSKPVAAADIPGDVDTINFTHQATIPKAA